MAERVRAVGYRVTAVDRGDYPFESDIPVVRADFDSPGWTEALPARTFDLITAIEVIEHVESPIGFLRAIGYLLAENGTAIITTPNVDSLPARLKFLLRGTIRAMDGGGDATHISPVFWWQFHERWLPRVDLDVAQYHPYPLDRPFKGGNPRYLKVIRNLGRPLKTPLIGDNHVFILKRRIGRPGQSLR